MAPETIDFTDSVDPFAPIPNGTYRLRVEKVETREAKETAKHPGSKYLSIEFIVTEDGPGKGRHLWMNASMYNDPQTIGMLKRTLIALGIPEADLEGSFDIDESALVGKECRAAVTVGKNPSTGEANNSVKRLLPLEEAESILP